MIALLLLLAAADAHQKAYDELVKEYDDALAAFRQAFDAAGTPKEKQAVFEAKHPKPAAFAPRFMAIARDGADSPAAVAALSWVVLHPVDPGIKESALRAEALDTLARKYAKDPRVGSLCTRLVMTLDPPSEAFLREMTKRATEKPALARAAASLGHNLRYRATVVTQLNANRSAVGVFERAWGKPAITALLKRDPEGMEKEALALFRRVQDRHGDLPHPTHGTMGRFAAAHIAAIEDPVGPDKRAPEISGTTLAGKEMKLSDYRGKVVLLAFWAQAFGSNERLFEAQKKLLTRLEGKPFALLGVNADGDRKAAARIGLSWPSWSDGGSGGPIATRWDVTAFPTIFVIDHKGVVRHVFFGWPEDAKLDEAITELVKKVGK
jgi:peroxiredoxin